MPEPDELTLEELLIALQGTLASSHRELEEGALLRQHLLDEARRTLEESSGRVLSDLGAMAATVRSLTEALRSLLQGLPPPAPRRVWLEASVLALLGLLVLILGVEIVRPEAFLPGHRRDALSLGSHLQAIYPRLSAGERKELGRILSSGESSAFRWPSPAVGSTSESTSREPGR
jgi:hypothetical protein